MGHFSLARKEQSARPVTRSGGPGRSYLPSWSSRGPGGTGPAGRAVHAAPARLALRSGGAGLAWVSRLADGAPGPLPPGRARGARRSRLAGWPFGPGNERSRPQCAIALLEEAQAAGQRGVLVRKLRCRKALPPPPSRYQFRSANSWPRLEALFALKQTDVMMFLRSRMLNKGKIMA